MTTKLSSKPKATTHSFTSIEKRSQNLWKKANCFKAVSKPKLRCQINPLSPAEPLHMGTCRNLVFCDVITRYLHMQNSQVIQSASWDSFADGVQLAAKEHGTSPSVFVAKMKKAQQDVMQRLGLAIDWKQQSDTIDSLAFAQKLFVKMWQSKPSLIDAEKKSGLAYWDPGAKSYIAPRKLVAGRGPESGMLVEIHPVKSYEVPVTKAHNRQLLKGLEKLSGWDMFIKNMQKESIGLEDGLTFRFELFSADNKKHDPLFVFTSRPDTIMGTTYVAVAANHSLAIKISENNKELADYCEQVISPEYAYQRLGENKSQDGMPLGVYAVNPINGDHIPVWVSNYIVSGYGTGAALGIPGHDQRNYNFAVRNNLPIRRVLAPWDAKPNETITSSYSDENGKTINSGELDKKLNTIKQKLSEDVSFDQLRKQVNKEVHDFLAKKNVEAKISSASRFRGWKISRQDYWGCPVPLVHCEKCGTVPAKLPIKLPVYEAGKDSLSDYPSFVNCKCPKCKKDAKRDTDTLASLFTTSLIHTQSSSSSMASRLLIDYYCCGVEHATNHLLCARIMHFTMQDTKTIDKNTGAEPFTNLICKGPVLNYGLPMDSCYANAVEANEALDQYGADALRLYLTTSVDPHSHLHWDDNRLVELQGIIDVNDLNQLRAGKIADVVVDRIERQIGKRSYFRVRHGLLDRYQYAQLLNGTLQASVTTKAMKLINEDELYQLRFGLLKRSELKLLRKNTLAKVKLEKVLKIITQKQLQDLRKDHVDIKELINQEQAKQLLGFIAEQKMDRLLSFIDGEKTEQLLGFCGRLQQLVLSLAPLIKSAKTAKLDDDRRSKLYRHLNEINLCYAGHKNNHNELALKLNRLTSKIKDIMALLETSFDSPLIAREGCEILLKVCYPLIPHLCEYLWQELKFKGMLSTASWPTVDTKAISKEALTTCVVQLNGSKKLELSITKKLSEAKIRDLAVAALKERAALSNQKIVKFICRTSASFVIANIVTNK